MRLRTFLSVAYTLSTFIALSQTSSNPPVTHLFSWAKGLGSTGSDGAQSIGIDNAENVYTAGYFSGTFIVDANTTLISAGGYDIFFTKHSKDGTLLWAKRIGGTSDDYAYDLDVDPSGNIVIAGSFHLAVDFDPSDATTVNRTSAGSADAFYAKYYTDGTYWTVNSFGGTGSDVANGIDFNAAGTQVSVTGEFTGSFSMVASPIGGSVTIQSNGGLDAFFGQFAVDGVNPRPFPIVLAGYGSTGTDRGYAVAVDASGNSYVTGIFSGTVLGITSAGSYDVFVLKLANAATIPSWVKRFGGTSADYGLDIGIDPSGNVIVAGYFYGAATGIGTLTSAGSADIFVARLTASTGATGRAFRAGGVNADLASGLSVSSSGDVFVAGYFSTSTALDPESTATTNTAAGGYDFFVARYNTSSTIAYCIVNDGCYYANFEGAISGGGSSTDRTYAVAAAASGNFYHAGQFATTSDFDFGSAVSSITSAGSYDAYLSRVTELATVPAAQPTSLVFSNVTYSSMATSFTGAAGPPSGYLILRKSGSAPTIDPVDGTAYSENNTMSDGSVVAYVGTSTSKTHTGLSQGTAYYYKVYTYNQLGTDPYTIKYRVASPLSGNATTVTLAAEPTASPTALSFTSITGNGFTVSFTASAPASAGYLVLRSTSNSFTSPSDGIEYTVGNSLGSATIVSSSAAISIPQSGLSPAAYYYRVYAYNGSGLTTNYRTAGYLSGNQGLEPSAQPTIPVFSDLQTTSMKLSLTAATGSATGYLWVRRAGSSPTFTPVDGTTYTEGSIQGDGSIITYVGSLTTRTISSLTAGTEYFFEIYSYWGEASGINYRTTSPLETSQFTKFTEPSVVPLITFFDRTTSTISGTVSPPVSGTPTGYIVVRATSNSPDPSFTDGQDYAVGMTSVSGAGGGSVIVHNGSSPTFLDNQAGLVAANTYRYVAVPYNGNGAVRNYFNSTDNNFQVSTLTNQPAGQPTSLIFGTTSNTSIQVSWTATSGVSGYIVVRRTEGFTGVFPMDGTSYTVGAQLGAGGGTVVSVSNVTSITDTGLSSGTEYFYSIFSYAGSGTGNLNTVNYNTTSPLQGSKLTTGTAVEPTSQPSAFVASDVAATTAAISFSPAAGNPGGYVVLRSPDAVPNTNPVDGVAYAVNNTLGNATVISKGPDTYISQTGLTESKQYFYKIFSYSGSAGGTNYLTTSPLSGNLTTLASEPSNAPTGMSFSSVTGTSFTMQFTAATGPTTADGYLVIRRDGAVSTFIPVDATSYSLNQVVGDGTVVSVGNTISIPQAGLTPGQEYSYKVYSYRGSGVSLNYKTDEYLSGSRTPPALEPTAQPGGFNVSSITSTSATISFNHASPQPTGYLLLRRPAADVNTNPVDETSYQVPQVLNVDNTITDMGEQTTVVADNLLPATQYFYKIYSFNGEGVSSNFLTTSPLTGSFFTLAEEPLGEPTGLAFENPGFANIKFTFSQVPSATSYLVIRKAGGAPTAIPSDGSGYATTLGDATVVYNGSFPENGIDNTGLAEGTTYYYDIYAYNGNNASANYFGTKLSGSATTMQVLVPASQPSNLSGDELTTSSFQVNFSPSPDGAEGYLVVRRTTAATTGTPANGVVYNPGDALGNGIVVYSGDQTTLEQVGLASQTSYYFTVFAFNGAGSFRKYLTTGPLQGTIATLVGEPVSQPSNLIFQNVKPFSFDVSFSATAANGYVVVRGTGGTPQFEPVDGQVYSTQDSTANYQVVAYGNVNSFQETGLAPSTTYYYKIFAFNGAGQTVNYTILFPLEGNRTTEPVPTPGNQPTNLQITNVTEASATLTFVAASSKPTHYLVVRKKDSPFSQLPPDKIYKKGDAIATDPAAIAVYFGEQTSFTDTVSSARLQPANTYHYSFFSVNSVDGEDAKTKILVTSPLSGNTTTLALEPTAAAEAVTFSNLTINSLDLAVTPSALANTSTTGYLVLRRSGGTPSATPVDGTVYAMGSTLGDATVVHVGATTAISQTGLTIGTSYSFKVFSYNGAGVTTNYLQSSSLTATTATLSLATEPVAQPTSPVFTSISETTINVSFTAATGNPDGYLLLMKTGATPVDLPIDGDSYTPGASYGTSSVVIFGSSTTASISNLTPGTRYFFALYAYNGTGTAKTTNFRKASPLVFDKYTRPSAPTANNVTAPTFDYFKATWTTVPSATKYLFDLSMTNTFSPMLTGYEAKEVTAAEIDLNDLIPDTFYYFRVRAENESGSSQYSNTISVKTGPAPEFTMTDPVYTHATTTNIAVTVAGGAGNRVVRFFSKGIIGGSFVEKPMTNSGSSYSVTLSESMFDQLGVEFYVEAKDVSQTIKKGGYVYRPVPSNTSVPGLVAGGKKANYRMISIPYDLNEDNTVLVFSSLGAYDKEKWRLLYWSNDKYIDNPSEVSPGYSYWFNSKELPNIVLADGTVVKHNLENDFTLTLQKGWNMIATPFPFNIDWDDILEINGDPNVSGYYPFNGQKYVESNVMEPWKGGFVNAREPVTLTLPVTLKTTAGGRKKSNREFNEVPGDANWMLRLTVRQGDIENELNAFGMHDNAEPGFDKYDIAALPHLFDYAELLSQHGGLLRDVVPHQDEFIWSFRLESNQRNPATLLWDEQAVSRSTASVLLYDEKAQRIIDMRKQGSYMITGDVGRLHFIYSRSKLLGETPANLLRAYPNPFRDEVHLPSFLNTSHTPASVNVSVISMTGLEIYNGVFLRETPGLIEPVWNGTTNSGEKVPSGMYLYRLVFNDGDRTISKDGKIFKH